MTVAIQAPMGAGTPSPTPTASPTPTPTPTASPTPTPSATSTSTPTPTATFTPTPTAHPRLASASTLISQIGGSIVQGTTDTGNHADDGTTPITLPFSYTLYDHTYTAANVDSNGTFQFESPPRSSRTPACLTQTARSDLLRIGTTSAPMPTPGAPPTPAAPVVFSHRYRARLPIGFSISNGAPFNLLLRPRRPTSK